MKNLLLLTAAAVLACTVPALARQDRSADDPATGSTPPAVPAEPLTGTQSAPPGVGPHAGPVTSPGQRPVTQGPAGLGMGMGPMGMVMMGGPIDVGPQADMIDGRIAHLKSELNLTKDQLPEWERFAEALRAQHVQMLTAHRRLQEEGPPADLMQRWDRMQEMMRIRLQAMDTLQTAFQPLYAELTPDQKEAAARLLPPRPAG